MSIIAIIPARGGSKRIPRKNIKNFMGKPMIAYAIEACLSSNIFDEVMVSTDDAEIAEIARSYGAKVPFIRTNAMSDDVAGTFEVLEEVLQEYKKIGQNFSSVCCVYPCVPFLNSTILKDAYSLYKDSNMDSLVPIVRFSFPIQRALKISAENCIEYREPTNAKCRSQDLETMYHDAGMFYYCKIDTMLKNKSIIARNTSYLELDEIKTQDIDNESDWQIAELKYKILYKL